MTGDGMRPRASGLVTAEPLPVGRRSGIWPGCSPRRCRTQAIGAPGSVSSSPSSPSARSTSVRSPGSFCSTSAPASSSSSGRTCSTVSAASSARSFASAAFSLALGVSLMPLPPDVRTFARCQAFAGRAGPQPGSLRSSVARPEWHYRRQRSVRPGGPCPRRSRRVMPGENLTRREAADRAAVVTTSTYDVVLDLRGETTFGSTTTIRFAATEGATTFVDLLAESVHRITLNGAQVPTAAFDGARIGLDGLAADNELSAEATSRFLNTGEGLHRFVAPVDGEVYPYSQFAVADARRVFAVFEQPDLKASYTFTVTAAEHWTVVS